MRFRADSREFLSSIRFVRTYNEMVMVHMSIHSEQFLEDRTTHGHEVVGEHALVALIERRLAKHVGDALEKCQNVLTGTHLTITRWGRETT